MQSEKVTVVKKSSKGGNTLIKVKHSNGFTDWVEVDPRAAKFIKVGTELAALGYATEAERDIAAAKVQSGEFPEIQRPELN